jgi:hypothetical protein
MISPFIKRLLLLLLVVVAVNVCLKAVADQMALKNAVEDYRVLTKRIILIPFDLPKFSEDAPAHLTQTNLETIFEKHHISVRLQGERFAIIFPAEYANFIASHELKGFSHTMMFPAAQMPGRSLYRTCVQRHALVLLPIFAGQRRPARFQL